MTISEVGKHVCDGKDGNTGGRQGWEDDSETVADKVVFLETWAMAGKVRGQRVAQAVW
jgi:hypothetical protein